MINVVLLLIVTFLPVYLIGLFVYKKDKEKEPGKLLGKFFIFGMLSCIPTLIFELLLGSFFPPEESMDMVTLFIYVFVTIAMIEEFFKWIFTYLIGFNNKEFDHVYDIIVYAVFVALGFAALENLLYVMTSDISTGLVRAVTAIPGHASDAIVMGYFLGLAKVAQVNNDDAKMKRNIVKSVIYPTVAHTIYDFCVFSKLPILILLFLVWLVFIYIYSIKKIKKISSIEGELTDVKVDNYYICPKCRGKLDKMYCSNCRQYISESQINNSNNLTQ